MKAATLWKSFIAFLLTGLFTAFITFNCFSEIHKVEHSGKLSVAPVDEEILVIRNAATEGIGNFATSKKISCEYLITWEDKFLAEEKHDGIAFLVNPVIRLVLTFFISIHAP